MDLSQPSLNGWMDGCGQAVEPGLEKEMEIYKVALFRLKAYASEGGISTSALQLKQKFWRVHISAHLDFFSQK